VKVRKCESSPAPLTVSEILLALFERLVHRVKHGRERVAVGDRPFEDSLVECALRRGQNGRQRVRVGVGCVKLTLASYPLLTPSARFQRDTTGGHRKNLNHSHAKVVSHVIITVLVGDRSVLHAMPSAPTRPRHPGQPSEKKVEVSSNPRKKWGVELSR
jgi:hypothetical protein